MSGTIARTAAKVGLQWTDTMITAECARPVFRLPRVIQPLVAARNDVRAHYGHSSLTFTFDGNLVGDLGEAVAIELFGMEVGPRCREGLDGHVGATSIQVKATGTGRGPAFRKVETEADHLLFFTLDLDAGFGAVEFNGPESVVRSYLPETWSGQKAISMKRIRAANLQVEPGSRLPLRHTSLM